MIIIICINHGPSIHFLPSVNARTHTGCAGVVWLCHCRVITWPFSVNAIIMNKSHFSTFCHCLMGFQLPLKSCFAVFFFHPMSLFLSLPFYPNSYFSLFPILWHFYFSHLSWNHYICTFLANEGFYGNRRFFNLGYFPNYEL